jgi:hypothetical protein
MFGVLRQRSCALPGALLGLMIVASGALWAQAGMARNEQSLRGILRKLARFWSRRGS